MKMEAIRGSLWALIETAGGQLLSFASFLILTRFLIPDDYGIVTLVGAIIAVPSILLNEGFGITLVQRANLDDGHINAAFWANLIGSLLVVLLAFIAADWAAELTHTPLVAPVLRWLSFTLVSVALVSIAEALFRRRLSYATFALRTLVATVAGALVAIVMALMNYGVWALVGMQLISSAVAVLVMWGGLNWRPSFTFSIPAFRDIFRFSAKLMLANGLRFATENADALIIGLYLSLTDLGLYFLATRLITMVNMVTISPVDRLMLPVMSAMQDDKIRLRGTYLKMIWVSTTLWLPAVAGLGAVSPRLLPILFGAQWQNAVPVMMAVSLVCLAHALTRATPHVLISLGKPEVYAKLNFIQLIFTLIGFMIAVKFGIVAAGFAFALVSLLMIPFHLVALRQIAGFPPAMIIARCLPIVGAGAIMVAAVLLAGTVTVGAGFVLNLWFVTLTVSADLLTLVFQIAIGAIVYPIALYALAGSQVRELLATVAESLPPSLRFLAPTKA